MTEKDSKRMQLKKPKMIKMSYKDLKAMQDKIKQLKSKPSMSATTKPTSSKMSFSSTTTTTKTTSSKFFFRVYKISSKATSTTTLVFTTTDLTTTPVIPSSKSTTQSVSKGKNSKKNSVIIRKNLKLCLLATPTKSKISQTNSFIFHGDKNLATVSVSSYRTASTNLEKMFDNSEKSMWMSLSSKEKSYISQSVKVNFLSPKVITKVRVSKSVS